MASGSTYIVKTGIGQTAYVAPSVTAKDDDDGFGYYAGNSNPFQAVHFGEKIGNCYQQVGAVHFVEVDQRSAPAIAQVTESATEDG